MNETNNNIKYNEGEITNKVNNLLESSPNQITKEKNTDNQKNRE